MRLPTDLAGSRANPTAFLIAMAAVNWFGFGVWQGLITNFGREEAGFGGFENGLMQSIREVPGLLAVTALLFLFVLREQSLAYVSLLLLGAGVAATGFFPSTTGILITTLIMSFGFHYYETMNQSLALQLIPKAEAPATLGLVASAQAQTQLVAYGMVALAFTLFSPSFLQMFLVAGLITIAGAIGVIAFFGRMQGEVAQTKGLVLKRRYGLYYLLTMLSGARRQIFMAFGAFLLVEHFGFSVAKIATLLLVTFAINTFAARLIGRWIGRIGERKSILFENASLILVFLGYAVATAGWVPAAGWVAAFFFVFDGVFAVMTIALRTYFQKIADPEDIAPTAGVAFTINHIMAVGVPFGFGLVWLWNPAAVFVIGALIASCSLSLAFLVPHAPRKGNEWVTARRIPAPAE
jgi:hypothetical protein